MCANLFGEREGFNRATYLGILQLLNCSSQQLAKEETRNAERAKLTRKYTATTTTTTTSFLKDVCPNMAKLKTSELLELSRKIKNMKSNQVASE